MTREYQGEVDETWIKDFDDDPHSRPWANERVNECMAMKFPDRTGYTIQCIESYRNSIVCFYETREEPDEWTELLTRWFLVIPSDYPHHGVEPIHIKLDGTYWGR